MRTTYGAWHVPVFAGHDGVGNFGRRCGHWKRKNDQRTAKKLILHVYAEGFYTIRIGG